MLYPVHSVTYCGTSLSSKILLVYEVGNTILEAKKLLEEFKYTISMILISEGS